MKKKYYILYIITLLTLNITAQDYSTLWEGHYSFFNIQDVSQGNNKVYAASENAIFIYNTINQELQELTTVEGLSGEYISTIHYSEIYELLLIGYENGLIEVYKEQDGEIITVVDIINKQNIPPDSKRINHFNEYNDIVYIATDYGISVYSLERLEFGDTYYIGPGGLQTKISQTTILDGWIYAASMDTTGIKRAPIDSENLIDFNEWEQFRNGNQFSSIQAVGDQLFVTSAKRIFRATPGGYSQLNLYSDIIIDVKEYNGILIVTTKSEVIIYDSIFNIQSSFGVTQPFESDFTSAIITDGGVYIGTKDYGILRTTTENSIIYEEIHPDGPLRNDPFSVIASNGEAWVTYGRYSEIYNPYPLNNYGISNLSNKQWRNISYDSIVNSLNRDVYELNFATINPLKTNQIFISSFFHGILEINDGEITNLLDESNSGLESLIIPTNPSYKDIRVSATTFDSNGLFWSITTRVSKPLKSYNLGTGQWNSYSFQDIIANPMDDEVGFKDLVIGNDGTKWIGSYRNGVIGFNENGNQIRNLNDETTTNLPSLDIRAIAMDNRNQLWIGTNRGLRVLYNTTNFFDEATVSTQPIIILEDGIPKELLERQYISDIKVDGSNNKWVGTIGAGVFYFTSDGQETIYHFTKDNSPLPSNYINEISIDNVNGEVYIATDKGLLSFGSGGSKPQETLSEAYVYPNPVRPDFDMFDKKVRIKDISENCNIKITDIEGNLVAEAQSRTNLRYNGFNLEIDGGTAYWNGKNLANNTVATGVYLVMLSDLDSFETRILKLMVIR